MNEIELLNQKVQILEDNLGNTDKKLKHSLNDNEVHISQIKFLNLKLEEVDNKNKELYNELNNFYNENQYLKEELNIKIKEINSYLSKIEELKEEFSNKLDGHQKVFNNYLIIRS